MTKNKNKGKKEEQIEKICNNAVEVSAVCASAIETFGVRPQLIVAIEELSELQKELTKALRNKINAYGISEEIADVEIMVQQLKMIFPNASEVEEIKTKKIARLKTSIQKYKSRDE